MTLHGPDPHNTADSGNPDSALLLSPLCLTLPLTKLLPVSLMLRFPRSLQAALGAGIEDGNCPKARQNFSSQA